MSNEMMLFEDQQYYYYLILLLPIGKLRHTDVRQLANDLHPVCFRLRIQTRQTGPRAFASDQQASLPPK